MTSRRRILKILAGAAMLPALGAEAGVNTRHWKGIALGAEAQIILDHPNADALIYQAVQEIRRLENIFSLYQSASQLSHLNRDGVLVQPAFEMVELLSICSRLNAQTKGIFDPTVQSLWSLYAESYVSGSQPSDEQLSIALAATGWDLVSFSTERIAFDRPGVMLTLNGIAQGFIADKVSELFRNNGVRNLLVNTGEIAALGTAPDGEAWQIKLGTHDGKQLSLRDAAIATSRPLGTVFDTNGSVGHILDPRSGISESVWSEVSVISRSAAEADGLSTAFCLMNEADIFEAKGDNDVFLT